MLRSSFPLTNIESLNLEPLVKDPRRIKLLLQRLQAVQGRAIDGLQLLIAMGKVDVPIQIVSFIFMT